MAKAGAIKAGEAFIRLYGDDADLKKSLEQASRRLRSLGTMLTAAGAGLAGLGGAALGGLYAAAKTFSDVGDAIDKMNKRTGLSTEFISEMGFAAEQSGSNIEELEKGVRKYQQTLGDAAAGNGAAIQAFDALGLSVEALMGMSPDEQFYAIAEAIRSIENPAEQVEAAMALLGRGGAQLIPLFKEGAAGMDALRRQARDLGLSFDGEAAQSAAKLNDALNSLNRALKATWTWIGGAVAPALTALLDALTPIVSGVTRWIRENSGVIVMLAQIAAAVLAVGAVLIGAGGAFILLGAAITGVMTVLGAVSAVFAGIVAFMASTPGMLIIIAGGIATVAAGLMDWGRAASWAKFQFLQFGDIARQTIRGIADAFAAGDIELAASIMWTGVKLVFTEGQASLMGIWNDIEAMTLSVWNGIWASLKMDASTAMNALAHILIEGVRAALQPMLGVIRMIQPGMAQGLENMLGVMATIATSAADSLHQTRIMNIATDLAQAQQAIAQANEQDRAFLQAKIDLLQTHLDLLNEIASEQRSITDAERQRQQAAMSRSDSIAQTSFGSRGSFNPNAVTSTAGSWTRVLEDVKEATIDTARNTREIASAMRGRGTFA